MTLNSNSFSGPLPSELSSLTECDVFTVYGNYLSPLSMAASESYPSGAGACAAVGPTICVPGSVCAGIT